MANGPFVVPQYFDNSGNPLNAGLVYTYLTGTSTLSSSYSDSGITSANANPLILASTGRGNVWLDPAINYDVVVKTSAGSTLSTTTNVSGDGRISGTFTITLSGCTASITGTARYTVYAGIVCLFIPSLIGTSNTTSAVLSGLPSAIDATRAQMIPVTQIIDNSVKYNAGALLVKADQTIVLYFSTGATTEYTAVFTSGNTKGITSILGEGTTITYSLI